MKKFLAPIQDLFRSSQDGIYKYSYEQLNASTQFNTYYKDREKLLAALTNPALLKVIALQCDMFSLGEIFLQDKNGKYIEDDPFLKFIEKPNPLQSKKQFLWDFMFWEMLGNVYLYIDSKTINAPGNKAYFMDPSKIDFPSSLQNEADKLIFSESKLKSVLNTPLRYVYDDGTGFNFSLSKLLISHDLTNGVGNMFKGPSRIDAIYKIISNSEYSLDAKNINIRYSGKFMVGAESTHEKLGLSPEEKEDIKNNMDRQEKKVYPMGSLAKIQRFVEDMGKLKLDESYLSDYFLIGSMYNIPKDVLEAHAGSATYENQEKARGSHVSYTLNPKGEEFTTQLEKYFGYNERGIKIVMDWSHLPFMQVFEKDRAETTKSKAETMKILMELGISLEDSKKLVYLE